MYYKILNRHGNELTRFVKLSDVVEGDVSAEKEVLEYADKRFNQVELWNSYQAFQDEKVRDVEFSELEEMVSEVEQAA